MENWKKKKKGEIRELDNIIPGVEGESGGKRGSGAQIDSSRYGAFPQDARVETWKFSHATSFGCKH